MIQPGRIFTGNGSPYRFSINGQEMSTEIALNTTTAEFWQYDSRISKRWNLDPRPNVSLSPYSCFEDNPILFNDILGDSIPTRFTDANGNKLNAIPAELQEHFEKEYGVKLAYNSKTEMLYYAGEGETDLKISPSAKKILVDALKDTKTGVKALKKYGRLNFGYQMPYPNGARENLTLGASGKTREFFSYGRISTKYREAYFDLADFDFDNEGKAYYMKFQNVPNRAYNLARVFEHEWIGHVLRKKRDPSFSPGRRQGATVEIVNEFQVEMGLPMRLNYGLVNVNGEIIFGNTLDKGYLKSVIDKLERGDKTGLQIITPTLRKE